jgi:sulfonate transport system permease protein
MIVAMILIGVVGYLMDKVLAAIETRLQSWRICDV